MRAKLVKTHKGTPIISITKTFSDAPALYEFLSEQGFYTDFKNCVDDLQLPEVTYTVALEVQSE